MYVILKDKYGGESTRFFAKSLSAKNMFSQILNNLPEILSKIINAKL